MLSNWIDLAREQGKHRLAVEQLAPFLGQPDSAISAGVHAALIHLHLDLGELVRAHELAKSLQALEPEGYRPHYLMGQILIRLDRWDEARDMFRAAVKKDPGSAIAWRDLVKSCAHIGDFKEGLVCLQQLANREWPTGWRRSWIYQRGVLYQQMANYSLALVSFTELALDCLARGMPQPRQRQPTLSRVPPSAPRAALCDAVDLLEQRGMQPFPDAGTLLGWWREGNFLAHDKDIDIKLPAGSDWGQVLAAVTGAVGFRLIPEAIGYSNFLSLHHRATGLVVDISHHEEAEEGRVKCVWRIPGVPDEQCRQTRQKAYPLVRDQWLGREFWRPQDPDRYLTELYGDWRTPMLNFDTVLSGHHLVGFPDTVRCYAYNRLAHALMEGNIDRGLSYVAQLLKKDPLDPVSNHVRNAVVARQGINNGSEVAAGET